MQMTDFDGYGYISKTCAEAYGLDELIEPVALANHIMKHPDMPMHYPFHHYLVPAVMLTAVYHFQKTDKAVLEKGLEIALERAKNVLPGFCGYYGNCGAAVGLGIFFSVLTETTPVSEETWGLANKITAGSLMEMAKLGGPRCCKRNTYTALAFAVPFIKEELGIALPATPKIVCAFSDMNAECKKEACPYFKED